MPKLTIAGEGEFEIPAGKRLVLAITEDAKVDQLHACGGFSRCTTCAVKFISGEPAKMTQAEKETLEAKGITDSRLSCQILCEEDMEIECPNRVSTSGKDSPGKIPAEGIEPSPEWVG